MTPELPTIFLTPFSLPGECPDIRRIRVRFQGNYTLVRIRKADGEVRVRRMDSVRLGDILEDLGFHGAVLSEPEFANMDVSCPSIWGTLYLEVQTNLATLVDLLVMYEEMDEQNVVGRSRLEGPIRRLVRSPGVRADLLAAQGFPTSDLRSIETERGILVLA